MKLFYLFCKCFKKNIKINDIEYDVICGKKYTVNGKMYMGNYGEEDNIYPDSLDPDIYIKSFLCIKNKKEKIMKYNTLNNEIYIYNSIYDASKDLKLEPNLIRKMSKDKIVINGEFIIKCFYI
jgi:hypothetical protein